jgi:chaperone required for assembly of F1-ATPase
VKRFYKDVSLARSEHGFAVLLDGKSVKTPRRAILALPTETLAEAIVQEWRAQDAKIDPATMPLTKLADTAIDGVTPRRAEVVAEILAYGASDHLCYRAEAPRELAARQRAAWDPLLGWAAEHYGAGLAIVTGIVHTAQSPASLGALAAGLESRDAFGLTGLHTAAAICASLVLALALADGRLDAAEAFELSQLDENFQAEAWGRDAEAEARAQRLLGELKAAGRFLHLARA